MWLGHSLLAQNIIWNAWHLLRTCGLYVSKPVCSKQLWSDKLHGLSLFPVLPCIFTNRPWQIGLSCWRFVCHFWTSVRILPNRFSYYWYCYYCCYKYSVIKKYGLNFVSLYFKIRTSDKCDVDYIWLEVQCWFEDETHAAHQSPSQFAE